MKQMKTIVSTVCVCAHVELLNVHGHMARDSMNHFLPLETFAFALPFAFRAGFFWDLVKPGVDPGPGLALPVFPSLV